MIGRAAVVAIPRAAVVAILLTAAPAAAQAQAARPCRDEAAALVKQVRAATARYADVDVAIADGYRRVGHDFPAMGEHWINLREAAADRFDSARPQILLYIENGGRRTIAGAAFLAIQDPGEAMPGPAILHGAWHEHSGTLDDELFAVGHAPGRPSDEMRVLVLHVWTRWTAEGSEFDVENWRLPFHREGLSPPERLDLAAARALSLPAAADYYTAALRRLGATDTERLRALVEGRAREVRAVVDRRRDARRLSPVELDALGTTWHRLMDDVGRAWPAAAPHLPQLVRMPHGSGVCS